MGICMKLEKQDSAIFTQIFKYETIFLTLESFCLNEPLSCQKRVRIKI